ncbi:MAG: peptidase M14 [Proteobacteria bacterium]|nr:MAG: peptidase M14 [Pseudomonadota bacterium]
MLKKIIALFCFMMATTLVAKPIDYYLPKGERYNASIPSPSSMLNQDLGDQHLRHDQIVQYMGMLAASSPQAKLVEYGRTHEGRRLVLLVISSEQNMQQFEQLPEREDLLKVWQGFSVHGNEPSGGNASVLYAWYVLSTNNQIIREALNNTVIIIDPTINPDGFDRFATFANSFRSRATVTDPYDMSHDEQWPSGRTNHYWFDLNRDWLLLTQPESRGRIVQYQKWQPHLITDHHEMGSAGSFFFQPGVPERKNPLIIDNNVTLTEKLADYHAQGLDKVGQSYYSRESFDDFYPGKGSTYPDLQGSVGVLFEQARAEGGVIETPNGERSLAAGIRNQFSTAVSSLVGAHALRDDFISHKSSFYDNAQKAAAKLNMNGFVVDVSNQPERAVQLLDFLDRHQIKAQNVATSQTINKHTFKKDQSIYISLKQPQTTLIQSLFATDKRFENNTFYDVSAWNLPMAWGLAWAPVTGSVDSNDQFNVPKSKNGYKKDAVAFAFNWHSVNAPAALHYLLAQQQDIFISAKPLHVDGKKLPAGSFVLPVKDQSEDDLFALLSAVSDQFAVEWHALRTFQADSGIDIGSPQVQQVNVPKVLMLVGRGINAYQAGSMWHLFDTQVHLPITKVRLNQLSQVPLHRYTHIIMPDGRYNKDFTEQHSDSLNQWVNNGGHLIGVQNGALWADQHLNSQTDDSQDNKVTQEKNDKDNPDIDNAEKEQTVAAKPYADFEADQAKRILGGAIVTAKADLTHPLSFGTFHENQYPLMQGDVVLTEPDNPYSTPLRLAKNVEAAGYVSDYWQEKLTEKPLIIAERMGRGSVIQFGFNPNFRGFWYGTQRWLINAVYLADLIRSTELNKE